MLFQHWRGVHFLRHAEWLLPFQVPLDRDLRCVLPRLLQLRIVSVPEQEIGCREIFREELRVNRNSLVPE